MCENPIAELSIQYLLQNSLQKDKSTILSILHIYLYRLSNYSSSTIMLHVDNNKAYMKNVELAPEYLFDDVLMYVNRHVFNTLEASLFDIKEDNSQHKLDVIIGNNLSLINTYKFKFYIYINSDKNEIKLFFNPTSLELLFPEEVSAHIFSLYNQMVTSDNLAINKVLFITQREWNYLSLASKDKILSEDDKNNLYDCFLCIVQDYGKKTAIQYNNISLTYSELDNQICLLSRFISDYLNPRKINYCVVFLDNPFDLVASIFAILKNRDIYIPLDTNFPQAYVSNLLSLIDVDIIVTEKKYQSFFKKMTTVTIVYVDDLETHSFKIKEDDNKKENSIASILFTSGTTSKQKGVRIKNKSFISLVKNTNYISILPNDVVMQTACISFDAGSFNIFSALLNGALLLFVDRNILLNADRLLDCLEENKVSIMFLTTRLFDEFVKCNDKLFSKLNYLLFGGEKVNAEIVRRVFVNGKPKHFLHCYGPTENTVFSTVYPITSLDEISETVPIGKPISGVCVYIADKYHNLMPPGVSGEILIVGNGLADGYVEEQVDNLKFTIMKHPLGEESNCVVYKSGDRGRWLHNSNLDFICRIDNMLKIRGHRIQPEYIESKIKTIFEVMDCCVKYDTKKQCLVAFINLHLEVTDKIKFKQLIRKKIQDMLPSYMWLGRVVLVDSFPLNLNGKIDVEKLLTNN